MKVERRMKGRTEAPGKPHIVNSHEGGKVGQEIDDAGQVILKDAMQRDIPPPNAKKHRRNEYHPETEGDKTRTLNMV